LSPHPLSCTPASPAGTRHPTARTHLLPSISPASPLPSLSLSPYSAPPASLLLLPAFLSNSPAYCFACSIPRNLFPLLLSPPLYHLLSPALSSRTPPLCFSPSHTRVLPHSISPLLPSPPPHSTALYSQPSPPRRRRRPRALAPAEAS